MSTKSDAPALRLIVEAGQRLAPASAFDAERLDSYAIGRVLRMTPVEEADRKDIRRWWAILNRAVKDTNTPWRTATQASEAIKLSLGIVEYGKTVKGGFLQWPKSLKELDDAELADAVRDMAALLHKMTGVDPLEWSKESADVGHDEVLSDKQPVPDQPAAADQEGGGQAEVSDPPPSDTDLTRRVLMAECVDNFLRDAGSEPASQRQAKINAWRETWKKELPEGQWHFIDLCHRTAEKLIDDPRQRAKAETYLKGLVK